MIEVFCEFRFEAAHSLELVPENHKCRRVHGHSYRVVITVRGELRGALKWVFDYAALEQVWNARVHSKLDHQNINEVLDERQTTSEFLAVWIASEMQAGLPSTVHVAEVVVWETARAGARWAP